MNTNTLKYVAIAVVNYGILSELIQARRDNDDFVDSLIFADSLTRGIIKGVFIPVTVPIVVIMRLYNGLSDVLYSSKNSHSEISETSQPQSDNCCEVVKNLEEYIEEIDTLVDATDAADASDESETSADTSLKNDSFDTSY